MVPIRQILSDGDPIRLEEPFPDFYTVNGRHMKTDDILTVWQPYCRIEMPSLNLVSLMVDWILTVERAAGYEKAVKWDRYLDGEYPEDTEYSLGDGL